MDDRITQATARIERKRARARAWYGRNRTRVNDKRRREYAQDMSTMRSSEQTYTIPKFFENYPALRTYLDGLTYEGERNPVDGVEYPGVDRRVPAEVGLEVFKRVRECIGEDVELSSVPPFFRLSPSGQAYPHQAHDDHTMGTWTLVVYLNRPEHCVGGTSLLAHNEGWYAAPYSTQQFSTWERDANIRNAWRIRKSFPMVSNTGVLFPSHYLHRSEPVGGFGIGARDGRLVLVGFFNSVSKEDTCKE